MRVALGQGEGLRRLVERQQRRGDATTGELVEQRQTDRPRPATEVHDDRGDAARGHFAQRNVDELLGLGTGYERSGVDVELEVPERPVTDDVLQRLAAKTSRRRLAQGLVAADVGELVDEPTRLTGVETGSDELGHQRGVSVRHFQPVGEPACRRAAR